MRAAFFFLHSWFYFLSFVLWMAAAGFRGVILFSPFYFLRIPGPPPWPLGVTGRPPELRPWYWYFAFFSLGFRIWKTEAFFNEEDMETHLHVTNVLVFDGMWSLSSLSLWPGTSTWGSRPRSSCPRRCQTPRSSWARRRGWPAGAWRRTHNRLRQPGKKEIRFIKLYPVNESQNTVLIGSK